MPGEQGPYGSRGIPGNQVNTNMATFNKKIYLTYHSQGPPGPKGKKGENKELVKVCNVNTT